MKTLFSFSGIILFISIFISCKEKPTPPAVTTTVISDISYTNATSGGIVTNEGGTPVASRGVCWNTSGNPTMSNRRTIDGSGSGAFASNITQLTPNTKYYLRAYATNSIGTGYGSQVTFSTLMLGSPSITTIPVTDITKTSVISGGNITNDNGSPVTTRGICWSTTTNPTVDLTTKTTDGSGIGNFTSSIADLTPNTTYYLRSYAVNNEGTGYGSEIVFKTFAAIDTAGNGYYSVDIGTQTWLTENLKTPKYRNGDLIGTTTPAALNITGESMPEYQWAYSGDETKVATYGRLYTWYVVNDSRNICPTGWHVPSDAEWTTMENYLIANGYNYDGTTVDNKLTKSLGDTILWLSSDIAGATGNTDYPASRNKTGFTARPCGLRLNTGTFFDIGKASYWWLSTEIDASFAFTRNMYYSGVEVNRIGNLKNEQAFSVRCMKDY